MVAPGYLKQLYQELLGNDKKPFTNAPPSPVTSSTTVHTQATPPTPSTTIISLSPYAAQDSSHSCATCSEHSKTYSTLYMLSQRLPTSCGTDVMLRWYVPSSLTKYCVMDKEHQVLERLSLPTTPDRPDGNWFDEVPIFSPSVGRASSALLNLNHTGVKGLHVVVTTASKMTSYMGAWQDRVIMALPDNQTVCKGRSVMAAFYILQFSPESKQVPRRKFLLRLALEAPFCTSCIYSAQSTGLVSNTLSVYFPHCQV